MNYVITFLEGIITFISPCMLPLLPVYVAYFAGGVDAMDTSDASEAEQAALRRARLKTTTIAACGFVLGFGLLFTLMGAFAGAIGGFLMRYQQILNLVCGLIVVIMGLSFMGVLKIPLLQKTMRLDNPLFNKTFKYGLTAFHILSGSMSADIFNSINIYGFL